MDAPSVWEFIEKFNEDNKNKWELLWTGERGPIWSTGIRLTYLGHPAYPSELIFSPTEVMDEAARNTLLSIIEDRKKKILDKYGENWEQEWEGMVKKSLENGGYIDIPLPLTGKVVHINAMAFGFDWRACFGAARVASRSVYSEGASNGR